MKFSATGMVYFSLSGKERLRRKLKEKEFLEMFLFTLDLYFFASRDARCETLVEGSRQDLPSFFVSVEQRDHHPKVGWNAAR